MHPHPVNILITIVLSALLSYGIVILNPDSGIDPTAASVGSFIFFASTLVTAFGLNYDAARTGVSLRLVALITFIFAVVINCVFKFSPFSTTSYVFISGISFLCFVLLANGIYHTNQ